MNDEWTTVCYTKERKERLKIPGYTINHSNVKKEFVKEYNKVDTPVKKTDDNDITPIKKFDKLGKEIAQARLNKNLTQKQLAQKLNLPASLIQQIENGSAVYDGNIYGKIKSVLNN